ncbi:MAG: hypothetical protein FWE21_06815 [Defluviitaleaceae bacterium]|nr:hypothetical protein [Defluviitaleaceae bacterium]
MTNEDRILVILDELLRGQAETNHKLGGVERRLDGVELRLGGVERRLDNVERRLDSVERRLDSVECRLDSMDARLAGLEQTHSELTTLVHGVMHQQNEDYNLLMDVNRKVEHLTITTQTHEEKLRII